MNNFPLVSIITPSYNQGCFLEDTILSVLGQTYPRVEYLVIDGGSTDNSLEIIRRYESRLAYWVSEPDLGQTNAINKGLARAKGQILGWLNSDDLLLANTVEMAVRVFLEEPDIGVVYGRLERINEQGRLIRTPELPKDRVEFGLDRVVGECIVNQPGSFWRRSAMERVGYLNESLNYAMDYDYWIRMALAGVKFKKLPQVMARFRLSSRSKTVAHVSDHAIEQMKILAWLIEQSDLTERLGLPRCKIDRRARETRARFCLYASYGYVKKREWGKAFSWLLSAIRDDPGVIFDLRWIKLGIARLSRMI